MTRIDGLLGLCSRSGQIILGADLALREIKAGRAGLALLDEGASEGTRKKISDACAYRGVPLRMLPEGELSRACGKDDRMAAAVQKGKLCQRLLELLTESGVTR
ncbi:MAG: hypothetical protein GX637_01780 [Clostridiales bacterium]|nr:hypothetical protein [Clostridiales bacterium]